MAWLQIEGLKEHSNSLLSKTASQFPISWTSESIKVGEKNFAAANHALICINPNPMNPDICLFSTFTCENWFAVTSQEGESQAEKKAVHEDCLL